jgi:hypothetical protein
MQMADTKHDQQIDSNFLEWWNEAVHYTKKDKWKPAVQDYLVFEYLEASNEKFSIELVKRIISHVSKYDDRWKRFPKDSFNTDLYKAHKAFYTMVEEELKILQD